MFKLISIFSYRFVLWVDGSIQMWPHCTFKIVYCSGLRTWIFGWTLWTVAEQTFTIRTPMRAWEWHRVQATHETPPALPSSSWAWIGRMWVAKYRSNNMALWHGAEAHVVSYCVCWRVRSHGGTLLLTGHLLGPFRRHPMTVLVIIIAILHCLLNVQRVGLHPVAMNLVWAVEQCTACVRCAFVHDIVRSLGAAIIARSPILRSISRYHLIDMNPTDVLIEQNLRYRCTWWVWVHALFRHALFQHTVFQQVLDSWAHYICCLEYAWPGCWRLTIDNGPA